MNVSGIRSIGGYINISNVSPSSAARTAEAGSAGNAGGSPSGHSAAQDLERIAEAKSKQTFTVEDYDAQYRPDDDRLKTRNDLRTADVERAVSDMQRDEVLHQYQYFVGEAGNGDTPAQQTAAANIRGAEDFAF